MGFKGLKRFFQNISIKYKLIFLLGLSAFVALLLSFVVMTLYHFKKDTQWSADATTNLAKVSANNIAAALTFLDEKAVESILMPALEDEDIVSIKVYDAQAQRFVALGRESLKEVDRSKRELLEVKQESVKTTMHSMQIIAVVSLANETIGYLEIIKDNASIKKKVLDQLLFSLFVIVLTLFIIFLLSIKFEKIFSRPIYFLLDAIKNIQKESNYSVCVISNSHDEFDALYKEFNKMMHEIQRRDMFLKQNNLSLENLVYSTANELEKTRENLKEFRVLATTDALSGLANRRSAMDKFEQMLCLAKQENRHLGVLMADIDHFKKVNDTYGHQVGDEVIKTVANVLLESVRKSDIAARVGGEEFLILFDNGDAGVVYEIAKRIRDKIETTPLKIADFDTFHVTISLGFCSVIPKEESLEQLLKRADDALYRAKKEGRNRVICEDVA